MTAQFSFFMQSFIEDSASLGKILSQLAGTSSKHVEIPTANFKDEFAIHFVPQNTHHPLVHVAGKSATGFFLASKIFFEDKLKLLADCNLNISHEESISEEEKIPLIPDLETVETERVQVGIPISQSIVQLLGSNPLHTQGRKIDSYVSHEALQPLNVQKARYLSSLYIRALKGVNGFELFPLWVFCNGASPQNMFYMATLPDAKIGSVRNVTVTCGGPMTEKENLPSLQTFVNQHRGPRQHQQVPVETRGYALYEVLGASNVIGGNLQEQQSCIFIEFAWDGVDAMLQRPPHTCDSVLHIKTIPGSMKLATQDLYVELLRLVDLNKVLDNPEVPWPQQEVVTGVTTVPVSQKMDMFFEQSNSGNLHASDNSHNEEEKDGALATPISRFTFRDFRKDYDFTEELWLFLKDALSETDYTSALQVIVSAVLDGSCQAVVHSANQTTLAKVIRGIVCSETTQEKMKIKQKFSDSILQEQSAVKYLVEVGIEKIRRDYANYFMGEELVTLNQLSYYLDTSCTVAEMVSRVLKLYSILEMVITLKLVLSMGHENLRMLVEAALTYYQNHNADNHPVFSMSLPAFGSPSVAAMKQTCTDSLPSVWCVALTTTAPKTPWQMSVVQLSSAHPVRGKDGIIADASELMSEVIGNKESFSFYLTHAKHSVVKIVKTT